MTKKADKVRIPIYYTAEEAGRLDEAVRNAYAQYRTVLIREALQWGLSNLNPHNTPRRQRVDVWIPIPLKDRLTKQAHRSHLGLQSLLRHLINQYITHAPWRTEGRAEENPANSEQEITP